MHISVDWAKPLPNGKAGNAPLFTQEEATGLRLIV
jgi:hypothetical protein